MPKASYDTDLEKYIEYNESAIGWWSEFPEVHRVAPEGMVRRCRHAENDWCYDYLPHISGDHSHMVTVSAPWPTGW